MISQIMVRHLFQQSLQDARDLLACTHCGAEHSCECICGNVFEYPGQEYSSAEIVSEVQGYVLAERDVRGLLPGETCYVAGEVVRRVR